MTPYLGEMNDDEVTVRSEHDWDGHDRWRTRLRSAAPYLASAVGGFVIAYLIVALFIFPATSVASDLSVPNVTGLGYDSATARLEEAGFETARGERRFDGAAPAGQVLGQTPLPGTTQPKGATVVLDVSRGQQNVEVPRLVGLTRQQAATAVEDAGLELGDVRQVENAAPRGQVLLSSPVEGASVPTPSRVDITVSDGPGTVNVPDLIGQDYGQARSLLGQLGFDVGEITYDQSGAFAANTVIGQSPAANTPAPAGTTIRLTVAGKP